MKRFTLILITLLFLGVLTSCAGWAQGPSTKETPPALPSGRTRTTENANPPPGNGRAVENATPPRPAARETPPALPSEPSYPTHKGPGSRASAVQGGYSSQGTQGPQGYQGATGATGATGAQGPPPSDEQVERVVDRVMASMDGAPVPASYKPILDLMVKQGVLSKVAPVGGYPDGKYKWQRPMTRAEGVLMIYRVAQEQNIKLENIGQGIELLVKTTNDHEIHIAGLETKVGQLEAADKKINNRIDWLAVGVLWLFAGALAAAMRQN